MGNCCVAKITSSKIPSLSSSNLSEESGCGSDSSTGWVSDSCLPLSLRGEGEILQCTNLRSFTFEELKTATRNFQPDSVVGEGGFGLVFKGWIDPQTFAPAKPGTETVIAVKKLNQEGFQGHKEWLNYNAKLSDFGLAKDDPTGDDSFVFTRIIGTYGYAAPEYLAYGRLTTKSDVYSFGVVLLEILTGRRSMDKYRPAAEYNLVEWAQSQLKSKKKVFKILDPQFSGQYSRRGVLMAAKLALRCLSKEASGRPDMHQVISVLEKIRNLNDGS
ncbi:Protein kinase APK1B [Carex littledalei]|uniref:Protein kinase APK1B n=1 Tax=Carex littledalei TaxID=544730 RepID=A0A833R708_9POAL|nr:Protein kinase APK1B [Carex littledalei]